MVKRLNAPRAGQYNQSAIERLVRDSTGDILPIDLADTDSVTGDLPLANLAQGSALSVLGVTGNATADNASIAAGTDGHVLRRAGTALAFGTVATAGIADDAVTYAKMQNVSAASKLLGRGSASGAGDAEEITLGTGLSMSGTTLNASTYSDPWTYVKLTSPQSNTSTSLVTTGLSVAGSSFATSTYYEFEALIGIKKSGGVATVTCEVSWPSANMNGVVHMDVAGTEASGDETGNVSITPTPSSSVFNLLRIRGYLYSDGLQPTGTLDIKTSISSGTLTVRRGSFLKYRAFT